VLLWQPTVWADAFTDNPRVLAAVFGLPFCLAPAAALLLSWWIVRRHAPSLIVWAVLGIVAAPLPGQIFVINDSILQLHLFWPLYLGLFVPLTAAKRVTLALLALFQLSHQIGAVLAFGGAAAVALHGVLGPRQTRRRSMWRAALMCLLCLAALAKAWAFPDDYAGREFSLRVALERWEQGVAGLPFLGLCCVWASAALLFIRARLNGPRKHKKRWLDVLAIAAALAGGGAWLYWASDAGRWAYALDYRRWVVPLSVPFYAFACFEAIRFSRHEGDASDVSDVPLDLAPRAVVAGVAAVTFAAVLFIQGMIWLSLTRRLVRFAEAYPSPVLPWSSVQWTHGTPLDHWAASSLLMALQGPKPQNLLLDDRGVAALQVPPHEVSLSFFDRRPAEPGPGGWFDVRPVVERYRQARRPNGGTATPPTAE
jgi:hypothetical protein